MSDSRAKDLQQQVLLRPCKVTCVLSQRSSSGRMLNKKRNRAKGERERKRRRERERKREEETWLIRAKISTMVCKPVAVFRVLKSCNSKCYFKL